MRTTHKRRRVLLGSLFGGGLAAAVIAALTLFAGAGTAAGKASPQNADPPTISGTAQEGKTLTGDRGTWTNNPTAYDYAWLRCDKNGGSCAAISGAVSRRYTLKSVDVGNTLRFRVTARNADGSANATSVQPRSSPRLRRRRLRVGTAVRRAATRIRRRASPRPRDCWSTRCRATRRL
jgi:hypothetical protein